MLMQKTTTTTATATTTAKKLKPQRDKKKIIFANKKYTVTLMNDVKNYSVAHTQTTHSHTHTLNLSHTGFLTRKHMINAL